MTSGFCFARVCVRFERMFAFGVRHYSPNTIHRHYSSVRSAMIVRCGLRGTKFGSLLVHALVYVCMCACVGELEMPKAFGSSLE